MNDVKVEGADPHLELKHHEVVCPNIGTINVYVQVSQTLLLSFLGVG